MMITLRSSLSTSVRMFSRRDSSMDKDRAFLFLGLFSVILLEKKNEQTSVNPYRGILQSNHLGIRLV